MRSEHRSASSQSRKFRGRRHQDNHEQRRQNQERHRQKHAHGGFAAFFDNVQPLAFA
jgi:hypothetical protein